MPLHRQPSNRIIFFGTDYAMGKQFIEYLNASSGKLSLILIIWNLLYGWCIFYHAK